MKRTLKTKKWLSAFFAMPAVAIFPLTSCGFAQPWDWLTSTKNNTEINYCLLIGQNDHADSQKRTQGTREALDTFDIKSWERSKQNANISNPKEGKITLHRDGLEKDPCEFRVREIEHMEQKSIGGAAWDPITANATASTWIAKHGNNITFFVSNNDSMAEGAMWASNWIPNLPIFGYDANSTTLQWIAAGDITGTVDQSPSNQCAGAMMLLRNMIEDRDWYWENGFKTDDTHKFGLSTYNPVARGFAEATKREDLGFVNADYFTQRHEEREEQPTPKGDFSIISNRELLSKSVAITQPKNIAEGFKVGNDIVDIANFIKKDGKTAKQPSDMFDSFTNIEKNNIPSKKYDICHTYSNRSEAFLVATMRPYYNEYARRMGLTPDIIEGDGTDETLVLNQIKARQRNYDGFLICLAKTTSGFQYVLDLAQKAFNFESSDSTRNNKRNAYLAQKLQKPGYKWSWNDDPNWTGWDNFEERLDTPLIFWIREPSKDEGGVNYDILFNRYFKYTYYVGSDASDAGRVQGKLIKSAITQWYTNSLDKKA